MSVTVKHAYPAYSTRHSATGTLQHRDIHTSTLLEIQVYIWPPYFSQQLSYCHNININCLGDQSYVDI